MTPERWQKLKILFDKALRLEAEEREKFLAESCDGDESLRREVEGLLLSHAKATGFIEQPAAEKVVSQILDSNEVLVAGRSIGRYEVIGLLGAGGMGQVYLAEDSRLKRKVALKVLPAEVAANHERMRRFVQEAKAASALNHPNILTIYEIDETESGHFIATEFVDGHTLRDYRGAAPMKLSEVLDVAVQISGALAAAHAAGIVHRDVKPDNVMVRRDGIIKILDFGIAKLVQADTPNTAIEVATRPLVQTEPGKVMGTPAYMSPEQVRGLEIDARTDIWSLGIVLYEMIAGRAPFTGETSSHVIVSILEKEPAPLAQFVPNIPSELPRIVRKTLAKDRNERYQTVRDLLVDLKNLRRDLDLQSEVQRSSAEASGSSSTHAGQPEKQGVSSSFTAGAAVIAQPATSSAEYLVGEIKKHKRGVVIGLVSLIAAAAIITTVVLVISQRSQLEPSPKQRTLSRLTFDPGLQSEPSWSPDGQFIAYSSDRSGNFDIWVQPTGEGNPVQVTKSPAHDWQPDWSADGKRIVFRSERDGGGLFVVPAPTGGTERKISPFGYRPVWRPGGTEVLFYSANLQNTPSPPKLYLVGMDGGSPREILSTTLSTMTGRLRAAWHPDGKRVSLWAEQRDGVLVFVTVPLADGLPVKSEINSQIEQQIRAAGVDLFDFRWAPSGQSLYFEGVSRGIHNIWRVALDPQTLRWVAGPERLTTGPGRDGNLSVSPDGRKLAFTTRAEQTRLWSIPFKAATGQVIKEGQPITPTGIDSLSFDVSRDGKKLAFITERAGKRELWEKSFTDETEKSLAAADEFSRSAPRWSRDGSRLAYVRSRPVSQERTEYEHTLEHAIVALDVRNGSQQQLTSHHQQQGWSWDWTADQQSILGSSARETPGVWGLYLYPLAAAPNAETQAKLVSSRPGYNAFNARFSPDEKWICFIGIKTDDAGDGSIFVVPSAGGEWTRITDGSDFNDKPRWSPDGRMIYFISNRTGFFNVWGRRFDPARGQPEGETIRVTNFESPGRMIPSRVVSMEIALAADRLVVPIMEVSGGIWILENVNR